MMSIAKLFRMLLLSAAGLIILAGLLLSVARLMLPVAGDYRAWLVDRVEGFVGGELQVESLDADWQGLGPALRLEGVTALDEGRPVLSFARGSVGLDVLASLIHREPRFTGLEIQGARLALPADGWQGLDLHRGPNLPRQALAAAVRGLPDWAFSIDELTVRSADIILPGGEATGPLRVSDIDVRFQNRGTAHRLSLQASLPRTLGETLQLEARLQGRAAQPQDWNGEIYLRGEDLNLAELGSRLETARLGVDQGRGDVEAWLRLAKGRLETVSGSAELREASLSADGETLLAADRVAASTWARRTGDGWRIDVMPLRIEQGQAIHTAERIQLQWTPESGRLEAAARSVALPLANRLAAVASAFTDEMPAALTDVTLDGRLESLTLRAERADEQWSIAADGRVAGMAARGLPGLDSVTGLAGDFALRPEGLVLAMDSPELAVDFGDLFPAPLEGEVQGRLRAARDPAGWWLRSEGLTLANADIAGQVGLTLDLRGDGAPYLDLEGQYRDARAVRVPAYLPVGIMDSRVVRWLEKAFVRGGEVPAGSVLFRGPVDRFPFRDGGGRFEVRAGFRDLQLDYRPDWPGTEGLAGRMAFVNQGMAIDLDRGETRGVPARDGQALIRDFRDPVLEMDLAVAGEAGRMLDFLRETPLVDAGSRLEAFELSGDASLDLALRLPLVKRLRDRRSVRGELNLAGSRLDSEEWDFGLQDLRGRLAFDELDFRARGIRGAFAGQPVSLEVTTQGAAARRETHVSMTGELSAASVLDGRAPALKPYIRGRSGWEVDVHIPHRRTPDRSVAVFLRSDLQGTAVELPCPFSKLAEQTQPFFLDLRPEADETQVRLQFGERLNGALRLGGEGDRLTPRAAELRLHADTAEMPPEGRFRVTGRMERFSYTDWQAILRALSDDGSGAWPLPQVLDLEFREFEIGGRELAELSLGVERQEAAWAIDVESADILAGLTIPRGASAAEPVEARVDYLRLDPFLEAAADDAPAVTRVDPGELPSLDVRLDRLDWAGRRFRDGRLMTSPVERGMAIHHLSLHTRHLDLKAQGSWKIGGQQEQRTELTLQVEGESLADGLDDLGLRNVLSGGEIRSARAEVKWPDVPYHFDWAEATGQGSFDIRDGTLENVEPGAGRAAGLFSIAALPRRLSLDFQDVFGKGYRFDELTGRFTLREGSIFSQKLEMDGPSGQIEITGRTGIVDRDFDQEVTVFPETSALPVIGALAGGTGVGAAVLLFQQVLKKDIQEAAKIQYRITGSWEDPQVQRVDGE